MPTPKGYTSSKKEDRASAQHVTITPLGADKYGLDVANKAVTNAGSDAVEAGSTTSVIVATAHSVAVGDMIRFTSGALSGVESYVSEVDTNNFTLWADLSVAPSALDTFDYFKSITQTLSSTGGTTSTLSFTRDGSAQEVVEDTGTPANNRPLPVKLTNVSGDITITADQLDVALNHANDSTKIGNGTNLMAVNASLEAQVRDDDANTLLGTIDVDTSTIAGDTTSIDGKITKCDTDTVTISAALPAGSNNIGDVDIASSALPTGAATSALQTSSEAILTTIDADTSALAGTVSGSEQQVDIVASLPAGSNNIGDVDVASSVLPTGAATSALQTSSEAILTTIDTDTGVIAGDTTSIDGKITACDTGAVVISGALPAGSANIGDVDVASSVLPTGAATEATLATIDADTSTIAGAVAGGQMQADVVAPLPSGTNTIGKVDVNYLTPKESVYFDASSTNIPGSASLPVQLLGSTNANSKKIQIFDTTGGFYGLYTGAAPLEVLSFIIGPGSNETIEVDMNLGTRLSLRSMTTTAITEGELAMNFIGV